METKIFVAVDSISLIQYVKISLDLYFQPLLSPQTGPLLNHVSRQIILLWGLLTQEISIDLKLTETYSVFRILHVYHFLILIVEYHLAICNSDN